MAAEKPNGIWVRAQTILLGLISAMATASFAWAWKIDRTVTVIETRLERVNETREQVLRNMHMIQDTLISDREVEMRLRALERSRPDGAAESRPDGA